jgi:quercetin dioxygenase-like cupin family protein
MIVFNEKIEEEILEEGVSRKIIARGGSMMMVEVKFKAGAKGMVHSHPHEQVSYVHSGVFEFELKGKKKKVSAGDSIYIESGVSHGVVALEDSVIVDVFTPQREDFLFK